MTCEQIKAEIQQGAILLDVRSWPEFQQARIHGAVLLPLSDLAERIHDMFEPGSKFLVYCRSGARSGYATSLLNQMGFEAKNIGGIHQYLPCAVI